MRLLGASRSLRAWDRRRSPPDEIHSRNIDHILEMGGIELFDHLNGGAAVLRDLINVGAFHETQTDIGVSQRVGRPAQSFPIKLQIEFIQHGIEVMRPQVWGGIQVQWDRAVDR